MGLASVGKGWGYIFMQEVGLLFREGASCYKEVGGACFL